MWRALALIASLIPRRGVIGIGRWLGVLCYDVLRIRRRVAEANLRRSLQLDPKQSRRVLRRAYSHLCTGAVEFLQLGTLTPEKAKEILGADGLEQLEGLQSQGRGVIALSAHLGQWDLLICAAALCGLKVNVLTRQIKNNGLNRYWMRQRTACGVRLLPSKGSARALVAALRRHEIVGVVLDQHEPDGIVVPFFGRPATTGTTLARLARATGASVVPVFLLRSKQGFRLSISDPIQIVKTGDPKKDLQENTVRLVKVLEDAIRQHPDQWLWLHRRWKAPQDSSQIFPRS